MSLNIKEYNKLVDEIVEKKSIGPGGFILSTKNVFFFRHMLDVLSKFGITEGSIMFRGKSDDQNACIFEVQQMDSSNIIMMCVQGFMRLVEFYKTSFDSGSGSIANIEIPIKTFLTTLENCANSNTLFLRYKQAGASSLEIVSTISDQQNQLMSINLLNIEREVLGVPVIEEDYHITMTCQKWKEIMKMFNSYACSDIRIIIENNDILFSSDCSSNQTTTIFCKINFANKVSKVSEEISTLHISIEEESSIENKKKRKIEVDHQPIKKRAKTMFDVESDEEEIVVKQENYNSDHEDDKLVGKYIDVVFSCVILEKTCFIGANSFATHVILKITAEHPMNICFKNKDAYGFISLYVAPRIGNTD